MLPAVTRIGKIPLAHKLRCIIRRQIDFRLSFARRKCISHEFLHSILAIFIDKKPSLGEALRIVDRGVQRHPTVVAKPNLNFAELREVLEATQGVDF